MFQAFGMLDHGELVLLDELCAEEFGDRRDEGDVVEDVPGSDDVDAAGGRAPGGDCRQAGEPFGAAADGLPAAVGEDEVDGGFDGLAVDAQELVGR